MTYRPGDRVLFHGQRDRGSVTVTRCKWHAGGGFWVVHHAAGNSAGCGPAEYCELAPEGFEEPPRPPANAIRHGLHHDAYMAASEEDAADPEYQQAYAVWREAWDAWKRKWGAS